MDASKLQLVCHYVYRMYQLYRMLSSMDGYIHLLACEYFRVSSVWQQSYPWSSKPPTGDFHSWRQAPKCRSKSAGILELAPGMWYSKVTYVTFQVGSGMDCKASNPIANDIGPGRPLQGVVSSRILLPGFFPRYINDKLKIPRAISHLKYLHMY